MMYKYGMRLRPFGIGCQPMDGYVDREPYEGFKYSDRYWDVIIYNRDRQGNQDNPHGSH